MRNYNIRATPDSQRFKSIAGWGTQHPAFFPTYTAVLYIDKNHEWFWQMRNGNLIINGWWPPKEGQVWHTGSDRTYTDWLHIMWHWPLVTYLEVLQHSFSLRQCKRYQKPSSTYLLCRPLSKVDSDKMLPLSLWWASEPDQLGQPEFCIKKSILPWYSYACPQFVGDWCDTPDLLVRGTLPTTLGVVGSIHTQSIFRWALKCLLCSFIEQIEWEMPPVGTF